MDNFRDSYFKVNWDLTTNSREGIYWGKQYDTGRGFVVTVINGDQVVTATNEVLRLKWEKPDNTTGYVKATIVNGKFIIENIDQMFTVQGLVRADFELSVGGKFVASTTFHVNVEKAVAVDAIESSSDFTALHSALLDVGTVQDSLDGYVDAESVRVANESIRIDNESIRIDNESNREAAEALRQTGYATMDEAIALKADLSEIEAARGTEPTLGARLDSTDAQLNNMTQDFTQHKLDYVAHKEDYNTLESEFTQHKLDYAEYLASELQTTHMTRILPNHQLADEIVENGSAIKKNISEWVVTKPNVYVNGIVNTAIWQAEGMTVVSIEKTQFTPSIPVIPDQNQYIRAYSPQFVNSGHEFREAEGQETFAIAKHSSVGFLRVRDEKTGVLSTDDNNIKLAKIQAWLRENPLRFIYELETPQIIPLPENMTPNTLSIVRLMNMNNWTNAISAAFRKPSTNKAYMTIVDDDGSTNVWTQLKPLSESLGVPFVIASISSLVGQSNKLTKEQLVELQNLHGWEITSHSHTHANLRVLTVAGKEYELSESKRVLQSYGLNVHNFVAPFGSNDDAKVRKIASRYYNCGVRVGGGINYKPITNQYVKRVALGAHAGENNTLSYYKSQVDEAKANNGWLIWMTHVGDPTHDATQQQHLNDVILYAQSLGIEIVTLQEGFEAMGNKLEVEGGVTITNDGEIYNSKLEGNLWNALDDILKSLVE